MTSSNLKKNRRTKDDEMMVNPINPDKSRSPFRIHYGLFRNRYGLRIGLPYVTPAYVTYGLRIG
jgi:hypothetical protein